jgi:hypothetical protein
MDSSCGGCGIDKSCTDNTIDYGGGTSGASSSGSGSTDIH